MREQKPTADGKRPELYWRGRRTLNAYRGVPCGDDLWEYDSKGWGQGEFDVRLLLDPEGGWHSEYLVKTDQPNALQPEIEVWATLYKNNHVDVLESALSSLSAARLQGAAQEREECAEVADALAGDYEEKCEHARANRDVDVARRYASKRNAAVQVAETIRARAQEKEGSDGR
jgi:hypothetical protein